MTLKEANKIIDKFGGDIYEDYSGRCMFGATTIGVTMDRYSFSEYCNSAMVKKYRMDNLGLDYIVY